MFVRGYQMSDCKEITELFYNTVHTINAKDYTKEQLDVWARKICFRYFHFTGNDFLFYIVNLIERLNCGIRINIDTIGSSIAHILD